MTADRMIRLHKARARVMYQSLVALGIKLRYSQSLEAIAATHAATWAELVQQPDMPMLEATAACQGAWRRLVYLGIQLQPSDIRYDVIELQISSEQALRTILPPVLAKHITSEVVKISYDVGQPMILGFVDGSSRISDPARNITREDYYYLINRVENRMEDRAGFTGSSIVIRGDVTIDSENLYPMLTIYANRPSSGFVKKLGNLIDENVVVVSPIYRYLGPYLRDIASYFLSQENVILHTFEWTGSMIGGSEKITGDFTRIKRTLADDYSEALSKVKKTAGYRTVVILEMPIDANGLEEIINRLISEDVQVFTGVYARDIDTVQRLPEGKTFSNRDIFRGAVMVSASDT